MIIDVVLPQMQMVYGTFVEFRVYQSLWIQFAEVMMRYMIKNYMYW